ncbi:aminoglycoside phosphotransferase family protein [uncultured Pelagimonas sp.]|uniref:aminoglycoside phosphotransferase family protein n=1 Tax=uncultured Pelagimonas sp. TaxID=1618102 RepID=UPI0026319303|nr:aminoglycoside phosphotransferase family protein [uncultured Pelagimonas sp.]
MRDNKGREGEQAAVRGEMNLQAALTTFGLTHPCELTRTGIAELWRVRGPQGQDWVLKLYHGQSMGNETHGVALMRAWGNVSSTHVPCIHGQIKNALVMDFLPGKTLGDGLRNGDWRANKDLGAFARDLHSLPLPPMPNFPILEEWFALLFELHISPDCPEDFKHDMGKAQNLARHLLGTQTDVRPLHGDLHHDNVFYEDQGFRTIDAKGVIAEPAYELANAMRNPKGCGGDLRNVGLQKERLRWFSQSLQVDQKRLAQWATAKCAWSIALRAKGTQKADPVSLGEADLLKLLLRLVDEA